MEDSLRIDAALLRCHSGLWARFDNTNKARLPNPLTDAQRKEFVERFVQSLLLCAFHDSAKIGYRKHRGTTTIDSRDVKTLQLIREELEKKGCAVSMRSIQRGKRREQVVTISW